MMVQPSKSLIIVVSSSWIARLIQVFALYVVFHGHYSPGGGFQGGALLAASILLLRLTEGSVASERSFKSAAGIKLSAAGALIFAGIGVWALAGGGVFLDYGKLTLPGVEGPDLRSKGILLIELGVALAVTAALVSIFDDVAGRPEDD